MFKKNEESLNNNLSLCIWGDGPGRPYDNVYTLTKKEIGNDIIKLYFDKNEECIIEKPIDVTWDGKRIKIRKAQKITWRFYNYGKTQTPENLCSIEYTMLNELHVQVKVKSNWLNRDEIIKVNQNYAMDSI